MDQLKLVLDVLILPAMGFMSWLGVCVVRHERDIAKKVDEERVRHIVREEVQTLHETHAKILTKLDDISLDIKAIQIKQAVREALESQD